MSNDEQSYTVSVVIPAYNAEEYVGRAIDSVLAQTRQPEEIIVVDDGSTDNTTEVIESYGSKVRFIRQEPVEGQRVQDLSFTRAPLQDEVDLIIADQGDRRRTLSE